jgi:hypothetical protein
MANGKSLLKTTGRIAYSGLVRTPLSIIRGFTAAHVIPSSINYGVKLEKSGNVENYTDPDCGQQLSFVDYEGLDDNFIGKTVKSHPYHNIFLLGRKGREKSSEIEKDLTEIAQHFAGLFGFFGAVSAYIGAVNEFGPKALIPIATTTALSLAHEVGFNRKFKKSLEILANKGK